MVETLPSELLHSVLAHMGLDQCPPTVPFLDELLDAYGRCVPWESISRRVRCTEVSEVAQRPRFAEDFWRVAVRHGSGGTCFESNYAFFALLRGLGFEGYLTINDMDQSRGCHTAIVILLDQQKWLVDAGFPVLAAVPLNPSETMHKASPYETYRVSPEPHGAFLVERLGHPKPYMFTLRDQPVDDNDYREATRQDYGPDGLFLSSVIIRQTVNGRITRFDGDEQPPLIQVLHKGTRTDWPIKGDIAMAITQWFGIDQQMTRRSLESVQRGANLA